MKLKKTNAITNGTRHELILRKNLLSKTSKLLKSNLIGFKKFSGRSNGRITVRHKGGGHKKLFRKINFSNKPHYAIVLGCEYDPYRSAFISLNYDLLGKNFFKTLQTNLVYPGSLISCSSSSDLNLGCRLFLKNIPTGSIIHSLSKPTSSTKYIRSAGVFGQLIQKDYKNCQVKLPSGKTISVSIDSYATIGTLSNNQQNLVVLGKAGRSRYRNTRPTVRGVAMNPVDHPHGGRTNGGRPSVTPWGIPTKGKPTAKKK